MLLLPLTVRPGAGASTMWAGGLRVNVLAARRPPVHWWWVAHCAHWDRARMGWALPHKDLEFQCKNWDSVRTTSVRSAWIEQGLEGRLAARRVSNRVALWGQLFWWSR